jgi:hypothetical protein
VIAGPYYGQSRLRTSYVGEGRIESAGMEDRLVALEIGGAIAKAGVDPTLEGQARNWHHLGGIGSSWALRYQGRQGGAQGVPC